MIVNRSITVATSNTRRRRPGAAVPSLRAFLLATALTGVLAGSIVAVAPSAAIAGPATLASEQIEFDIPQQPLGKALLSFSRQAKISVLFSSNIGKSRMSAPVTGAHPAAETLDMLLAGTGFTYKVGGARTVSIHAKARPAAQAQRSDASPAAGVVLTSYEGEAAAATASSVEEIVVVGAKRKFAPEDSSAATKINMDVIDTPQSLSVLSSELMSIVGVNSINSAAQLAPSVIDQEGEVPVFIDIVARGFEVDFWNGNKINGMPFLNGGGPVDFGIADRFEVVRGPASIIYGQSDYGATVNVTLKSPKAKRAFAGEIGGNIDGGYRALVDVTGALTDDQRLRGRLVVIYDNNKTPQDMVYARTTTVAPSISYDITESTKFDFNFFHGDRQARRTYGFGLVQEETAPDVFEYSLPDISRNAFLSADFSNIQAAMDFGVAKLTHDFGGSWVLTATGALHHTSFHWREPFAADFITPENGGVIPLYNYQSNQESYDKSADLSLVGDFQALGQTHTLMLSGFYRHNKVNYFSSCFDPIGDIDVFNPESSGFSSSCGVFPSDPENSPQTSGVDYSEHGIAKDMAFSGLLLLHPVDRLSVMLGLRYNEYQSTNVDFYDHSSEHQAPYKNHATTHRVGVVYEVAKSVNVYGSYSDGVIFHPSQTDPDGQYAGKPLPPETGVQWEIGAKAGLFDRKLTVSAAAFKIDRKNVATHDPDTLPNSPFSIPIGGQTHKGIELEAIGEPIPGWNIISSYSYLDVKITDSPNSVEIGKQRANAPHHMVKLYSTYQLLNGPLKGASFGGGMFYVGKREVDNEGTFQLPAYTRFDLRLGYDGFENVSFSVNAINITDKKIYVSQDNWAGGGIDFQNRRTVMFKMNFKY